jgi:ATP-binding protein involved in chromosome partitioning
VRDAARKAGAQDVRLATAEKRQRRIIAVGSGKGGVGKSTLLGQSAVAMARLGRKVGLVDADIYGPSQPRLLAPRAASPRPRQEDDPGAQPVGRADAVDGAPCPAGQAIAWRGPMAGGALGQLIEAHWGDAEVSWSTCRRAPATCS